jgi:hypothetical protein
VKSHLSPSELVDVAEGAIDGDRAAHVSQCSVCAAAAADLRAALHGAQSARDEVPEPSPLFWDHLSSRVQQALVNDSPPRSSWWAPGLRTLAPLAAFALVVIVLTMMLPRQSPRPGISTASDVTSPALGADADRPFDPAVDATTADAWDVLTAAAADLEWDAAQEAGMAVHPAAIDRAVQQLAPEELAELGKLLQSELKRSGD